MAVAFAVSLARSGGMEGKDGAWLDVRSLMLRSVTDQEEKDGRCSSFCRENTKG